jgi:hypothetical protein
VAAMKVNFWLGKFSHVWMMTMIVCCQYTLHCDIDYGLSIIRALRKEMLKGSLMGRWGETKQETTPISWTFPYVGGFFI